MSRKKHLILRISTLNFRWWEDGEEGNYFYLHCFSLAFSYGWKGKPLCNTLLVKPLLFQSRVRMMYLSVCVCVFVCMCACVCMCVCVCVCGGDYGIATKFNWSSFLMACPGYTMHLYCIQILLSSLKKSSGVMVL